MKKKRLKDYPELNRLIGKGLMIMRLSLILMVVGVLQSAASVYSQNWRMSMNEKSIVVKDVLTKIENSSEFRFFYEEKKVNVEKKVDVEITNATIEDIMNLLFNNEGVDYKVLDSNFIVLKPKGDSSSPTINSSQQKKSVTGKVTDASGATVPGVSVIVKSTTIGVITDNNGSYSLSNVPENATLKFSFVGMKTQEIKIGNQTSINVVLAEETVGIEEVVAIGYGTQKRINLTGSVSSVSVKDLEDRPQPNVQSMIQGKVTGLQITSNSGRPGNDLGTMLIRGKGSFSDSGEKIGPLVLIDGIEGDLSTLAPSDIENLSVLKDAASASIYGSRAANGVILVTTKKGKVGKPQFTFTSKFGLQNPTRLSDQIWNSAEYMKMYNETRNRMTGFGVANTFYNYPQSFIDKYSDPNRNTTLYPDYNWIEETYHSGQIKENQVAISGGTDIITYNISLGYLGQAGVLDRYNYNRYTSLINIETKVNNSLKIGIKSSAYYGQVQEPIFAISDFMLTIQGLAPTFKPFLPDGSGRYAIAPVPFNVPLSGAIAGFTPFGSNYNTNPHAIMDLTSNTVDTWHASEQVYFNLDILKKEKMKLILNGTAGFKFDNILQRVHAPQNMPLYSYLPNSEFASGGAKDAFALIKQPALLPGNSNNDKKNIYTIFYTTLDYSWQINKTNKLNVMAGYQEETNSFRTLSASRQVYTSDAMMEIDGGSTSTQTTGGGLSQYNMRSFFGRINYSIKDRYLLEGNIRYDGTSRISKDYRWGTFPSASAAWRVSEESFIKDNFSWVDNFKARASFGMLGNSQIGNYPYQPVYDVGTDYLFNGTPQSSVVRNNLTDQSLQWETTSILDFGADLLLWKGLFGLTFDWYNKITDGILSTAQIPMSIGMGAPTINFGKMQNRGYEIEATHQNKIGKFSYAINGMISVNKNEVLELKATDVSGNYIYKVGYPYGEHYLFIQDGLFQSEKEVKDYSTQPGGSMVHAGDIKLVDFTPQDHAVTKAGDRQMVEGVYPKMLYSFGCNASYFNFDINAFFQGVSGRTIYVVDFGIDPFLQGAPPDVKFRDAWTPSNTDTNVPALYFNGYGNYNKGFAASTYNLYDASYLRLKNLQIGYNIPQKTLSKIKINYLRIYFSGENLVTWTPYPSYDPEREGDGRFAWFPQLKTYALGLNIKF